MAEGDPIEVRMYLAAREVLLWVDEMMWDSYGPVSVWACITGLENEESIEYARKIVREWPGG